MFHFFRALQRQQFNPLAPSITFHVSGREINFAAPMSTSQSSSDGSGFRWPQLVRDTFVGRINSSDNAVRTLIQDVLVNSDAELICG